MTITKEQKEKVLEVLEELAEDAAYESYESGGEENVDNVNPYYKRICRVLGLVTKSFSSNVTFVASPGSTARIRKLNLRVKSRSVAIW